MLEGPRELTEEIISCYDFFNPDRVAALDAVREVIASHYSVPILEVRWRDFRTPGWHIDPPGRFFVKGEPLKLFVHLPWSEEE